MDYINLNKACPKDLFPLQKINQLVNITTDNAYSGYSQIPLHLKNEEKISFITLRVLFCYKAMLFGLKNTGPFIKGMSP